MSEAQLVFKTKTDFIQAAFEQVAKIVSDHAQPCLEALTPALSAQRCLSHLALVAHDWSYDPSLIDAYAETYKKANQELLDAFGDEQ